MKLYLHYIHAYTSTVLSPSISREIYPRTKYYTDNSSYTRVTPSGKKLYQKQVEFSLLAPKVMPLLHEFSSDFIVRFILVRFVIVTKGNRI